LHCAIDRRLDRWSWNPRSVRQLVTTLTFASEDRPSPSSVHCPLSVCQPGPFVRPLNKEGTAHNESQYWQANSNACNDRGQRRRLIRAERQPQSQGSIRWTLDGGRWTVDGGHGTSRSGANDGATKWNETNQVARSPSRTMTDNRNGARTGQLFCIHLL